MPCLLPAINPVQLILHTKKTTPSNISTEPKKQQKNLQIKEERNRRGVFISELTLLWEQLQYTAIFPTIESNRLTYHKVNMVLLCSQSWNIAMMIIYNTAVY